MPHLLSEGQCIQLRRSIAKFQKSLQATLHSNDDQLDESRGKNGRHGTRTTDTARNAVVFGPMSMPSTGTQILPILATSLKLTLSIVCPNIVATTQAIQETAVGGEKFCHHERRRWRIAPLIVHFLVLICLSMPSLCLFRRESQLQYYLIFESFTLPSPEA